MQGGGSFEPTDNDARIMLQILLTEARRFHVARPNSMRRPSSASRSVLDSSANSSVSNGSVCSLRSMTSTPPPQPNSQIHLPYDSPEDSGLEEVSYDGWTDLQSQIENAWAGDASSVPHVKYQRIKSYLTCLFIWDPTRDWEEFEDASPAASLQWISTRQQARLAALPPGKLFVDEQLALDAS